MATLNRLVLLGVSVLIAKPVLACEPVVPFMQVMERTLTLSRSMIVLVIAVVLKSALFATFERRLPHLRAHVANVPWYRLDELCWPTRHNDDRECSGCVARRSTPGLLSLLATSAQANEDDLIVLRA